MTDSASGVIAAALAWAVLAATSPVAAQELEIAAPADLPWCQVDDPAAWRAAREALVASGSRNLAAIACPEPQGGAALPAELTLPMPCGRAMVFRRIDVPVAHALDQVAAAYGRAVDVAAETPQTVLSNGAWEAPVAGAFTLGPDGPLASDALGAAIARSYYMAKYELTAPQWDLFERGLFDLDPGETASSGAPACAAYREALMMLDLRTVPAKGGLSWFDAVAFSRAMSGWLLRRDRARIAEGLAPDLPWEQGATGYVRLPTESEWEYAARGGVSEVTVQSRSVRLPVVIAPETGEVTAPDLDEVCAPPPRDPGDLVGPVGQERPNRLGLHDVICNAEEIVLDLFRPTRPDGLGGQVGGVLTKGGTSVLFRDGNTVGRRSEAAALFGLDGEGATPTMGVRFAIGAPVFVGRRDTDDAFAEGRVNAPLEAAMLEGRDALLDAGVVLNTIDGAALEAELRRVQRELSAGQLTQEQLEGRVSDLQVELDRLTVSLTAQTTESVRLTIRSGVVTASLIDRLGRNLFDAMRRITDVRATGAADAQTLADLAEAEERLLVISRRIDAAFDLYLQIQAELGRADEAFVVRQIAETERGQSGSRSDVFDEALATFARHQAELRGNRGLVGEDMRPRWLEELDVVRPLRRERFPELEP